MEKNIMILGGAVALVIVLAAVFFLMQPAVDTTPSEDKQSDDMVDKSGDEKQTDNQTTDKPTEDKPIDEKPSKPTDDEKPTEDKTTDDSKPEETALDPVEYDHPVGSGTSDKDCFDDICITRGGTGPLLTEGDVQWGCGTCDSISEWSDQIDADFRTSCIGGRMVEIVDVEICLKTSKGSWDVNFTSFTGGGPSGGFSYTRTFYE